MNDIVICKNCERVFDTHPHESADNRQPCPECGSTARVIHFSAKGEISFGGSVELSGGVDVTIPTLLMQTFVEKGDKTDDGEIIITVTAIWDEIIKLIEKDPSIIYKIDFRKLEEIVAGLHKRTGLFDDVILTPRTRGDYGRDIVLIKHGHYALHFFDQVKAYAPKRLVTADMIKASIGTMQGNNYQKAIITTTSDFAPEILKDPAIQRFYPKQLELVNGEELRQRLIEYSKKK